jgi:hypothetical protein
MPVDPDPVPDGNLVLTPGGAAISSHDVPLAAVVDPAQPTLDDPPRYRSHFATCPNADQHRRRTTP